MALAFYMLSSFYLTFAVYLQSGLHETPLAAGLATLPFATGFFVASLVSSYVMQFLGVRALTLGFALQVLGFGVVMLRSPRFYRRAWSSVWFAPASGSGRSCRP